MLFFGGCIEEDLNIVYDMLEDYIMLDFRDIATHVIIKNEDNTFVLRPIYSNKFLSLDTFTFRLFDENYKEYKLDVKELYLAIKSGKVFSCVDTIYRFSRSKVVLYNYMVDVSNVFPLRNYTLVKSAELGKFIVINSSGLRITTLILKDINLLDIFWKNYSKMLLLDS